MGLNNGIHPLHADFSGFFCGYSIFCSQRLDWSLQLSVFTKNQKGKLVNSEMKIQHLSSEEVQLQGFSRSYYWFKDNSFIIKPVLLTLLFLLSLYATFRAFYSFDDSSYIRELNSAIIGALITAPLSIAVALFAFWERVRSETEHRRVDKQGKRSRKNRAIQIGRMIIPDISVIASASHHKAWDFDKDIVWRHGNRRVLSEEIIALRDQRLPEIKETAKSNDVVFENLPCLDLVGFNEVLDRRTKRRTFYFTTAEMWYYDFAATANILDQYYEENVTIREHFDIHYDEDFPLSDLPVNAKMGCGTVVITSDNQILMGIRKKTFVAGINDHNSAYDCQLSQPVHFVAEGMIPEDVTSMPPTHPAGLRNLAGDVASLRAQQEELNIGTGTNHIAGVSELYGTGFFFDHVRMQPCFSYLSRVDKNANEFMSRASEAKDQWEMDTLLAWNFSLDNPEIIRLLLNKHPRYHLASNHAAALLWFACVFEFGFDAMSERLHRFRV